MNTELEVSLGEIRGHRCIHESESRNQRKGSGGWDFKRDENDRKDPPVVYEFSILIFFSPISNLLPYSSRLIARGIPKISVFFSSSSCTFFLTFLLFFELTSHWGTIVKEKAQTHPLNRSRPYISSVCIRKAATMSRWRPMTPKSCSISILIFFLFHEDNSATENTISCFISGCVCVHVFGIQNRPEIHEVGGPHARTR